MEKGKVSPIENDRFFRNPPPPRKAGFKETPPYDSRIRSEPGTNAARGGANDRLPVARGQAHARAVRSAQSRKSRCRSLALGPAEDFFQCGRSEFRKIGEISKTPLDPSGNRWNSLATRLPRPCVRKDRICGRVRADRSGLERQLEQRKPILRPNARLPP